MFSFQLSQYFGFIVYFIISREYKYIIIHIPNWSFLSYCPASGYTDVNKIGNLRQKKMWLKAVIKIRNVKTMEFYFDEKTSLQSFSK